METTTEYVQFELEPLATTEVDGLPATVGCSTCNGCSHGGCAGCAVTQ